MNPELKGTSLHLSHSLVIYGIFENDLEETDLTDICRNSLLGRKNSQCKAQRPRAHGASTVWLGQDWQSEEWRDDVREGTGGHGEFTGPSGPPEASLHQAGKTP